MSSLGVNVFNNNRSRSLLPDMDGFSLPVPSRRQSRIYAADDNGDDDESPAPTERVQLTVAEMRAAARYASITAASGGLPTSGWGGTAATCRGTRRIGSSAPPRRSLSAITDLFRGDDDNTCTCGNGAQGSRRCPIHIFLIRPSLRPSGLQRNEVETDGQGGSFGSLSPSAAYLRSAKVPSMEASSDHPLAVISIEGVLEAHLPAHLSGGHTDVLSRLYLQTLMDYLLHPNTRWSVAFWSGSKTRKEALQTLKSLKLPTGSAEKDERDGVLGVWSKEDLSHGYDGGELGVKDLEVMWKELEDEEGIRFTLEDTVVITANPDYMRKQPYNFILAPAYHYRMSTPTWDDQFLLMMVHCLEDLTTETNFASYIRTNKWDREDLWTSNDPKWASIRDSYVHNAVRICGSRNILIKAGGGN